MTDSNHRKRLLFAGSIAISAALLYFALRGVEWHSVFGIVAGARWPFLLLGLALSPVQAFLRALRWRILLNAQGSASLRTVFWANSAGYLGNSFLPGRAGELIRTMMISTRSHLTTAYVLTTALTERASDLLFLLVSASVALATMHGLPAWLEHASHTMTAIGVAAAIALALVPKTQRLMSWLLMRLPVSLTLRQKLMSIAEQVRLGVEALHRPLRFMQFAAMTVIIWTGDVLLSMLLAYTLHLSLSFSQALILITALGLSSAIPSAPGYVGVFQFVAVTVLVPFGFTRSDALAYILLTQALQYLVTSVLGLMALVHFNLTMSSFKSVQMSPASLPDAGAI